MNKDRNITIIQELLMDLFGEEVLTNENFNDNTVSFKMYLNNNIKLLRVTDEALENLQLVESYIKDNIKEIFSEENFFLLKDRML